MIQAGFPPQPPVQPPTLSIAVQPAEFHQFRYKKDVTDNRLGGILKGRHSGSQGESFTRLKVAGISEELHYVCVRGCTVTPELEPHPFLLHGDDCQNGAFLLRQEVTRRHVESGKMEISLERLSIVSVRNDDVAEELNSRAVNGFNPDLRHLQANISIDRVFPVDLSLHGGQQVFIYFTKPLSDQSPDSYEIAISPHGNQDQNCELRLKPIEVKPNIIALETPREQQLRDHLTRGAPHERVNANLRVTCCSTGQQSKESQLIFCDSCATCGQRIRAEARPLQPPPSKQQRLERVNFAVQQDADFSLPKLDIGQLFQEVLLDAADPPLASLGQ
uniref:RHD domain-containing protein n=1 Tax=Macrostomum lignano TaxID=282301 RepID=A0A1I8ICY7_9PLAT